MSDASDHARVSVILADFASIEDTSKKPNLLGAGTSVLGGAPAPITPGVPPVVLTPPFSVFVSISVPPTLIGEEYAMSLDLRDSAGQVVNMPGSAGDEKLRIAQVVRIEAPNAPGATIPQSALWPRFNLAITFSGGLPLAGGSTYWWTVEIDGNGNDAWRCDFFVLTPPRPPVIG